MKKRVLSIPLALCMALSMPPAALRSIRPVHWGSPEMLIPGDSAAMTPVLIFASDAGHTYSSSPYRKG